MSESTHAVEISVTVPWHRLFEATARCGYQMLSEPNAGKIFSMREANMLIDLGKRIEKVVADRSKDEKPKPRA